MLPGRQLGGVREQEGMLCMGRMSRRAAMCWFYLKMNLVILRGNRESINRSTYLWLKFFPPSLHLREMQKLSSLQACGQTGLFGQMEHFPPRRSKDLPMGHTNPHGKTQPLGSTFIALPAQAACHMICGFKYDSGCLGAGGSPQKQHSHSGK